MYVPIYQGLGPADLVKPVERRGRCFPFDRPDALPFYRARNAIYHLFRILREANPKLSVLAPDYNSGNEILAMRAAGVKIHYYPVGRDMQADPAQIEKLAALHSPDLLYTIHYVGWPQPMSALADLCRRREMLLVEDCALALLSEIDGRPLGSFGHWSVFCLYKTLPVPNGALLVQNGFKLESLERLRLRRAGLASLLARTTELVVQRIRGRVNGVGSALQGAKRALGLTAQAMNVHRANVGDIGFNLGEVNLAMSRLSSRLLNSLDFADIRRRRVANYRTLAADLNGHARPVYPRLPDGVCPLFFPLFVDDKHAAATALHKRGVDALEFWNDDMDPAGRSLSPDARFLRQHVLELPIHQDLTRRQISHVADQVLNLHISR